MHPYDLAFYDLDAVRRCVPSALWPELAAWDRQTVGERAELLKALLALPAKAARAAA